MKKYILLLMTLFTVWSCENADYQAIDNSVYLADAAGTNKSMTVTMEKGLDLQIVVRLAKKCESDVNVIIGFNPQHLQAYNEQNGTEYADLPADKLPENIDVTIPAGSINTSVKLHIDDFDTNGITYAIPVEIKNVSSEEEVIKSIEQGQFIYVLAKPLIVSVPVMKGYNGEKITAAPGEDSPWGIEVDQWTIEAWVKMSDYSNNNQAIFTSGSKDHEIYVRFGDANRPYNYLQVKTLGGQVDTAKDLVKNTWYHWAFVYDGTTFTIYRNGVKDVSFNPPAPKGGKVRIDRMFMIGSGSYFRDNCSMSQVRLWKIARSESEIKNNMYYEVNPQNENLIGYWPMDEGSGNTFADITGNGHDATADSHIVKGWEHDIRFDK